MQQYYQKYEFIIILVLEDNWLIKLLFRHHTFITYDKLYQTSKKQTKHLIIDNSKTK